jgi:hypothetical protein
LLHGYVGWDLIPRTRLDTESQLGKLSSVLCFPGLDVVYVFIDFLKAARSDSSIDKEDGEA